MKEILIVSGKGGSGKTSLSACFAQLAGRSVLVDCDVDASDLPLLLHPTPGEHTPFVAGELPEINPDLCTGCGRCLELCRFDALQMVQTHAQLKVTGCEGCGVCFDYCPSGAITMVPRRCGDKFRSPCDCGVLYHASLLPGAENSGKLIAELRQAAKLEAEKLGVDYLLCDGPPGIGCPVISAATGTDLAAIVTEPTVSGVHDMRRLAELLHRFEIPFGLIVNKCDLNEAVTQEIADWCASHRVPLWGKIPFAEIFPAALCAGKTVLDCGNSAAAEIIKDIWWQLTAALTQGEKND